MTLCKGCKHEASLGALSPAECEDCKPSGYTVDEYIHYVDIKFKTTTNIRPTDIINALNSRLDITDLVVAHHRY